MKLSAPIISLASGTTTLEILKISLCENVLETTELEFIITVPAIWSEAAQDRTRSCAERAGMGTGLKLISEPEAAIMHAVDQELSHMEIGDIVVVCDAGGGTVDLISYIIDQLKPFLISAKLPLVLDMLAAVIFSTKDFARCCRTSSVIVQVGLADDTLQGALEYFETAVKRRFNGSDDEWLIPVPGLPDDKDTGIRRGKFHMPGSDIRDLFEPIITMVTL